MGKAINLSCMQVGEKNYPLLHIVEFIFSNNKNVKVCHEHEEIL